MSGALSSACVGARARRVTGSPAGRWPLPAAPDGPAGWVYGPDGELLGRQNGLTRETFLVDTLGTPDPNDDVLTPRVTRSPRGW